VQLEHVGEHVTGGSLGVPVGQGERGLLDVLDRRITGVGRGDPCREAANI
jgi:hypothetical protein